MSAEQRASKQGTLIASNVALICISGLAVAFRLLSRRISKAKLWWDDYTIIVAMPLAWALPIINIIGKPLLPSLSLALDLMAQSIN